MNRANAKEAALGAIAGIAGTLLIRGIIAASQKTMPQTLPPMKEDPGQFMVRKTKQLLPRRARRRIPKSTETIAAQVLAFGYAATFGCLYAEIRHDHGKSIFDGAALGAISWAIGYLGWLPAAKLMPPVWKQRPRQVLPNLLGHIVYGIATVALYTRLRERLENQFERPSRVRRQLMRGTEPRILQKTLP